MSKKSGLVLGCRHCSKRYDMDALSMEAKENGKRNIYCPHCGKRVAQLQS